MTLSGGIGLVVPTYRRPDHLASLLGAVASFRPAVDEVVVVAGDDESVEVARRCGVTAVRVDNRSAAASRNAGWQLVTSTYVGFLDDDCLPPPTWAGAAVAALTQPLPDRSLPAAVGGPVTDAAPAGAVTDVAQHWLDRRYPDGVADWLASQNLALPRAVLDRVGGFDESMSAYEDVDLSTRIRETVGELVRTSTMTVGHRHRAELSALYAQHRNYGRGFVQMARKHPGWSQARRAPLGPMPTLRATGLALARPVRCAAELPTWRGRLRSLPVLYVREAAFLSGAVREARS